MSKTKLPNLIIAGVVKGGTTSLFSYLSQHPEICSSSVKETCYFSAYRYGQLDSRYRNSNDPDQQYQSYFKHCEQQKYIMEATPGYFEGGSQLAEEIKKLLGNDVKVVIILREPIERLISFLKYKKSMLEIEKYVTIEEYVNQCLSLPYSERIKQENDTFWGIDGGYYANYIEDWLNVFGGSLKILFFDDLKNNSRQLMVNIFDWLMIDNSIINNINFQVENKSINYKNPLLQRFALSANSNLEEFWRANPAIKNNIRNFYYKINGMPHEKDISDITIQKLKKLYDPYNQKLANILINSGYTNLPQWLIF